MPRIEINTSRMLAAKMTLLLYILTLLFKSGLSSIACYTCDSKNYTDTYCDDPMSPAFVPLEVNCKVPKENHVGTFPANFCVKMIGTSLITGEHLVIRTCVLEDMNSQCGTFRFENDTLKGCILTCDYDGCNPAPPRPRSSWMTMVSAVTAILFVSHFSLATTSFSPD